MDTAVSFVSSYDDGGEKVVDKSVTVCKHCATRVAYAYGNMTKVSDINPLRQLTVQDGEGQSQQDNFSSAAIKQPYSEEPDKAKCRTKALGISSPKTNSLMLHDKLYLYKTTNTKIEILKEQQLLNVGYILQSVFLPRLHCIALSLQSDMNNHVSQHLLKMTVFAKEMKSLLELAFLLSCSARISSAQT